MNDWTPEKVEERMVEAVAVLRRLPGPRKQGYFSTWPRMMVEFSDLVGQTPEPMKLPPPSAAAITRMEAALEWMTWLEPEDSKLVWMRSERHQWKAICWRFGLSRATANRRFDYALSLITWRLNGRHVPTKRSRRFVVERVRTMPRQP